MRLLPNPIPLAPLFKGGKGGVKVPLFKGDLGGSRYVQRPIKLVLSIDSTDKLESLNFQGKSGLHPSLDVR